MLFSLSSGCKCEQSLPPLIQQEKDRAGCEQDKDACGLHDKEYQGLIPVMLEHSVNATAENEEHERSHDKASDMDQHNGDHVNNSEHKCADQGNESEW